MTYIKKSDKSNFIKNITETQKIEEINCSSAGEVNRECVFKLIEKYSAEYGVPKKLATDIAACESSFRPDVYGDTGKAYGIYQFHKPTFELFSKKIGEDLDYYNVEDNIKLAMWAIANDKGRHWSCYKKLVK